VVGRLDCARRRRCGCIERLGAYQYTILAQQIFSRRRRGKARQCLSICMLGTGLICRGKLGISVLPHQLLFLTFLIRVAMQTFVVFMRQRDPTHPSIFRRLRGHSRERGIRFRSVHSWEIFGRLAQCTKEMGSQVYGDASKAAKKCSVFGGEVLYKCCVS
jgi:hypothetical protein